MAAKTRKLIMVVYEESHQWGASVGVAGIYSSTAEAEKVAETLRKQWPSYTVTLRRSHLNVVEPIELFDYEE